MAKRSSSAATPRLGGVNPGEVWSVPVRDVGFFPLVIARAPAPKAPVPLAFAYLLLHPTTDPPDPAKLPPIADWGRAWIGLVPLRPFRTGRWKLAGRLPEF